MRRFVVLTAIMAVALLFASQALAGHGNPCAGVSGGYSETVVTQPAQPNVAAAPSNRSYSYQPGSAPVQVTAPPVVTAPRVYRSYSYSPSIRRDYPNGVRGAGAKSNFDYGLPTFRGRY